MNPRLHLWIAARYAAAYTAVAMAWILGSDRVVGWMFGHDMAAVQRAQTYKGLFFVSLMGLLVFAGVLRIQRLQRRRRQAEAMLEVSQRLEVVGSFAGALAHDLNNMLLVVRGLTEIAQMEAAQDGAVSGGRLQEIEGAVVRTTDMVRQLSTFVRGADDSARRIEVEATVRSFEPLLRQALTRGVRFDLHVEPDLPPVEIAPVALEQVLLNLAVNARDAMEGRPDPRLDLTIRAVELRGHRSVFSGGPRTGRFVRLRLQDTGVGIPPERLVRVFDPFFTTKADGRGTGLGLASVMRTMQRAAGWVELNSVVGHGSVFELFLPAVPEDQTAFAYSERTHCQPVGAGSSLSP